MQYRRDIDGLRSVAIIPVVLFHAGLSVFSGGYVGVDVFFVISGFLITSVIMSALDKGNFSFRHFYERRARRLLPALFAVLIFCVAVGFFIMSPVQYQDMGSAIIATVFYVTNFLMWSRSGYFQSDSEYDPLLHMWSLSVEEQFYIFYPILLIIFVRMLKSRPLAIVCVISVFSFILSVWGVANKPNPTFFLLPTRAWELGLGAIISLSLIGSNWNAPVRNGFGLIGLALILFSIVVYTPATPFPGIAAVPPVLGTAMIIAAGRGGSNIIGKLLSWGPLVGIGLISYSLYLWHWPIFVFLNIHFGLHHVPVFATVIGLILSVVLATLSWKYVEQPFRASGGFSRKQIFTYSGIGIAIFTLIGGVMWGTKGFETRFDSATNAAFRAAEGNAYRERCLSRHLDQGLCELGVKEGQPSFVLWGDSHAMSAAHGFDVAALKSQKSGLLAAHSDCPPILGTSGSPLHNGGSCDRFRRDILDKILGDENIDLIILHARWARYAEPELPWEIGTPPMFKLANEEMTPFKGENYSRNFVDEGLLAMVEVLKSNGKTVHVVEGVPEQPIGGAYAVGRHLGFGADLPAPIDRAHAENRGQIFDRIGPSIDETGAIRYSVLDRFCDESCDYVREDKPLYEDDNHLSLYGAEVAFSDYPFESLQ